MPFAINDVVKRKDGTRSKGVVEATGCFNTTAAGGKTCSRKNCAHNPKDYLFVRWPDGTLTSDNENAFDLENATTGVAADALVDEEAMKKAEADKAAKEKQLEEKMKSFEATSKDFPFTDKLSDKQCKEYFGLTKEAFKNLPKLG